ncbi:MAG: hypothetical protein ACK56F_23615, partial [bacterium]
SSPYKTWNSLETRIYSSSNSYYSYNSSDGFIKGSINLSNCYNYSKLQILIDKADFSIFFAT